jgi:phosphomannomutase
VPATACAAHHKHVRASHTLRYSWPKTLERSRSHRIAEALVRKASFPGAEVCTIDGLRVDWPDGFSLVRASNTAPMLVLRFEGHTPGAMQRIQGEMLSLLRTVKPDARIADGPH